MVDYEECKICYNIVPVEFESICDKCLRKILKSLGVELTKDFDCKEEDKELVDFVCLVSKLGGLVNYLEHAIENHTHGTRTVNTVDIE